MTPKGTANPKPAPAAASASRAAAGSSFWLRFVRRLDAGKLQAHSVSEPFMIKHLRISLRHVTEPDLPTLVKVSGDPGARGEFNTSRIASPHAIQKRFQDNGFSSDEHELLLICNELGIVIGDVVHFQAKRYSTAREIGWTIHDYGK